MAGELCLSNHAELVDLCLAGLLALGIALLTVSGKAGKPPPAILWRRCGMNKRPGLAAFPKKIKGDLSLIVRCSFADGWVRDCPYLKSMLNGL
jgi:hypothetical protein